MKHLTLAIFTALLLSATPVTAQELWGGAHAGMSVVQVQKIFSTLELEDERRSKEWYVSRQITVQENPYVPRFKFVGGKLGRVSLSYHGEEYADGGPSFDRAHEHLFSPVLAALRAKYGPEQSAVYKAPEQKSLLRFTTEKDERVWITNNRRITISIFEGLANEKESVLSFAITYEPLAVADLDKL